MNNFNPPHEPNEFKRVIDYLTSTGNISFPTDNISQWVNAIEKKTNVHMYIPQTMNEEVFSSIEQYLEEYQKRADCSMNKIPDTALKAILDGISYVNTRKSILNEAELAVLMITQLLRIKCIVLYSKNIMVQPRERNFELCISYNNSFKKTYKMSIIRM